MGHIVGVIPARGGSKRFPGKNLATLCGKPLLEYTVEAARGAESLDRVVLSTDSEEIAAAGRRLGVEVPFLRPTELADDTSMTPSAIEHAIAFLERNERYPVDVVVTLQPTSPLRRAEHIDRVVRTLLDRADLDSAVTVRTAAVPPFWMLRLDEQQLRPFVDNGVDHSLVPREQLEQVVELNGAVYVTRRQLLARQGVLFSVFAGGKTGYLLMNEVDSLDVDTELDLAVAEAILRGRPSATGS